MILDETGRYALTQLNESTLWRYDMRWRGVTMHQPYGDNPITTVEGTHYVLVVHQANDGSDITATVRGPRDLEVVLASGTFNDGKWSFEGEVDYWEKVPEYIIVKRADGGPALVRLADDADIDPLEGFKSALRVSHVPDSRLVVIAGEGAYTVYDPIARRAIRHYELSGKNSNPYLRFRNADELWINDTDTMLKLDTKKFQVVDAAGSETGSEDVDQSKLPPDLGNFGRWTFAADNELCVVTRPNMGDVLILDGVTMLPVGRGIFGQVRPIDALLAGRNKIVAVDEKGFGHRARTRRVNIRFINEED